MNVHIYFIFKFRLDYSDAESFCFDGVVFVADFLGVLLFAPDSFGSFSSLVLNFFLSGSSESLLSSFSSQRDFSSSSSFIKFNKSSRFSSFSVSRSSFDYSIRPNHKNKIHNLSFFIENKNTKNSP
ncbi:hypothetical protein BpHYR1_043641 [Brachionus plicatilis]|uniref:Uncharacterized protein n=1 Tax=Brachionus plicatilis TaxID=10195 RepID=A0A3M7RM24_BRAPC|nr:hypothetical protein BpHYR1_043641 [Brachionus plicatilis]